MLFGGALFGIVAYLVQKVLVIGSRPPHMPPGPPTEPFWGNQKQLSGVPHPEHVYTEWARKYGPVYTVMNGSQPWIIVSGAAEAHEIFHKRGQQTAGRPLNKMELAMRSGFFPGFMSGPKWRVARKLWHAVLNVGASRQYLPLQELEAKQLLADVVSDGQAWRSHIERYAGSVAMTMMNGTRLTANMDSTAREIIDDLAEFAVHATQNAWIEKMPLVWSLPEWAVPARRKAGEIAGRHMGMILRHWNATKTRIAEGLSLPCFNRVIMDRLRESGLENRLTENEAAEVGGVGNCRHRHYSEQLAQLGWRDGLVSGCAKKGTGRSVAQSLVSYRDAFSDSCLLLPEIDRVVGSSRLPNEDDAPNLQYVRQVVQETHRWVTAVPLGLFHATTEPFQWGPYLIPAGTTMVINAYAIHSDPVLYPNPKEFVPERWGGKLESTASMTDDRIGARSEFFAFGAGHRICPGQHVAERGLFLAISRWLWSFNTRKAKDAETGAEREIDMENVRPGLVVSLDEVAAEVKPRSQERAKLIEELWERDKEEFLDQQTQWKKSPKGVEDVMDRAVGF